MGTSEESMHPKIPAERTGVWGNLSIGFYPVLFAGFHGDINKSTFLGCTFTSSFIPQLQQRPFAKAESGKIGIRVGLWSTVNVGSCRTVHHCE